MHMAKAVTSESATHCHLLGPSRWLTLTASLPAQPPPTSSSPSGHSAAPLASTTTAAKGAQKAKACVCSSDSHTQELFLGRLTFPCALQPPLTRWYPSSHWAVDVAPFSLLCLKMMSFAGTCSLHWGVQVLSLSNPGAHCCASVASSPGNLSGQWRRSVAGESCFVRSACTCKGGNSRVLCSGRLPSLKIGFRHSRIVALFVVRFTKLWMT
mmetsp:Transcript_108199/g.258221  ORF Transcript_108199/g.258221 Transcript_108199/m.258221 type:complete len:211 (-) Transcript_108199:1155-1787(-)